MSTTLAAKPSLAAAFLASAAIPSALLDSVANRIVSGIFRRATAAGADIGTPATAAW